MLYVILGVLKNEMCYKTGRVRTRDFTVVATRLLIRGISTKKDMKDFSTLMFKILVQELYYCKALAGKYKARTTKFASQIIS